MAENSNQFREYDAVLGSQREFQCFHTLGENSSRKHICSLCGHRGSVLSVMFSPDGQTLISASRDNTIKFWDVHTGELLRTIDGHSSVVLSSDGQTLVSGNEDGTIKVWGFSR